MAWIEQTKKGSIRSGGPQYYLQDLTPANRAFLDKEERCSVRLWTPYGVIDSRLTAVSRRVGSVGHDRIQSGCQVPSVADQVAFWFNLNRTNVERIEFQDSADAQGLVIRPTHVKFFAQERPRALDFDSHPLTLIQGHQSSLITTQVRSLDRHWRGWVAEQIRTIVHEHEEAARHVDERDLLRASGALSQLGITLGMYRVKGLDCPDAEFHFAPYPPYACPIEIEECSSGFLAGQHKEHRRKRVVVVCMSNDARQALGEYVEVIELRELNRLLQSVA